MKTQVVYELSGVDADDGVDIFAIAPVLMQFGELVRSANGVLGLGLDIDVRVKPFSRGSWITEFVLAGDIVTNLINYLHTSEGRDVAQLLAFLGFSVKDGVVGLAQIVRFTCGKVGNFHRNADETVTYESPDGGKIIVSLAEHKLVQSPAIQVNYYGSIIAPLDKFPTATGVALRVGERDGKAQSFTADDKPAFEEYVKAELLEDVEQNVSTWSGVFIKPKRGSYSGDEKAYSFIIGEGQVLWPVTIDDEAFLQRLKSGEIRPFAEDVLRVDMQVAQKVDSRNKVTTHYTITKVIEYIRFEQPKQLRLDDSRTS